MSTDAAGRHGRNALWVVLGQGAGQGLALLVFLFLARYVSQSSFGLMAVSITIVEFIRRLLIDPVTIAVYSRPDAVEEDYDICFTIIVVAGVTSAAALFLLAYPVASLLGSPETGGVLQMMAFLLVGYGLSGTPGALLARRMEFKALALRAVLSVTLGGSVGLLMAINGFELWSLVAQQFTIALINVVTLWTSARWRPRLLLRWDRIRDIMRRSRPISITTLFNAVAMESDLIFVASFFGPVGAGLYNAAKRFLLAANLMLVNSVSTFALPALANLESKAERRDAFAIGIRMTSAICAPAFAGLAIISPELIRITLGESWAAAAPILEALAPSGYFLALNQAASSILVVSQRAHLDSFCAAMIALVNICVFSATAHSGAVALAGALSVTMLLLVPLRLGFALRELELGWRQVLGELALSIAATGAMAIVLLPLRGILEAHCPAIVTMTICIAAGALIYAGTLRVLAPRLFASLTDTLGAIIGRGRSRQDIALAVSASAQRL